MLITAELLLHYQRCHRRAFLDVYGDRASKDPYSDFQLKLQQARLQHQELVLQEQISQGAPSCHQPEYAYKDWQAGAKATIALMRQGVERIKDGVLLTTAQLQAGKLNFEADASQAETLTLISKPDLLVKQPGKSVFGDWLYVPIDIHLGKRPKKEYQIIAAYHTQLLALTQGAWAEKAWLILREQGDYEVDLWRWLPTMQEVLDRCVEEILQARSPEPFISRQQCSLCPWLSNCHAIAKAQEHLSLVPGVTPSRYKYLQQVGLTSLEALAQANPKDLESEFNRNLARHLIRQAQSVLQQQPAINSFTACTPTLALPTASVELYFDIEAQPDLNLEYLLGVLVVNREANTEIFHPLLAESPEAEESVWQQFLALVETYPNAPIYHFSPYEADTVKRLGKRYKTPFKQTQAILNRFVDIHQHITDAVTLPLEGYSLKAIANWIGFHWRDPQANGSQAIFWYDEWLETGDRSLLEIIVRYNEDDCHATHRVKDWLLDFVTKNVCVADEVMPVERSQPSISAI